jgi:branched-chain amino acid transport system ATP-binding protein
MTLTKIESIGASSPNDLLRLDHVTLKFGGLTALSDVSWGIPASGIHGIIGPNGAGKSTLFNIITGIYKPLTGKISFAQKEIQAMKTTQIVRLGIARTFQNIRLLPHLSVMENLCVVGATEREGTFWLSLFGMPRAKTQAAEIRDRAKALLNWVGLARAENKAPTSLPYGDQRKLEIARALMRKPQLLLLDEPAAGMNPLEKDTLAELLKKVVDQNITILVIEHDMKFIMNLCGDISVLNQGAICARGTPSDIQNNPLVIESYLGKRKRAK